VKEDEVDRDRRRQSAEKLKSAKDSAKKGGKKKNLDRQALEARRAKSRQRGSLRKNPPATTTMTTRVATTPRGWRHVLTRSSRARLEVTLTSLGRRLRRRVRADPTALGPTRLLRPWPVRSRRAVPLRLGGVAMLGPRRRGL